MINIRIIIGRKCSDIDVKNSWCRLIGEGCTILIGDGRVHEFSTWRQYLIQLCPFPPENR